MADITIKPIEKTEYGRADHICCEVRSWSRTDKLYVMEGLASDEIICWSHLLVLLGAIHHTLREE